MVVEALQAREVVQALQARAYGVVAADSRETRVVALEARQPRVEALDARATRVAAMDPGEPIGALPLRNSVIVILQDDLSPLWLDFMNLGAKYGTGDLAFSTEQFRYARTPFMTDIAQSSGIWFSNAFATPICSSSRARMHFGNRTDALGVGTNVRGPSQATSPTTYPSTGIKIANSNTSIAKFLRAQDTTIATAHFGKWHMCDPWSSVVTANASNPPDVNLTDPFSKGFQTSVWSPLPYGGKYTWWKIDNGTPSYVDGEGTATYDETTYPSCVMAKAAIQWLQARTDHFFLSLSVDPPHMPLTSPPWTWTYGNLLSAETQAELTSFGYLPGDNLTGAEQFQTARNNPEFYAAYRANIEVADSIAAAVWANVPQNLRATTYLVILSDNGGAASTIPDGFPASGKGTLTRGGTQVHMLIRGPGVAHPGREVKQLVDISDIPATIAHLMGFPTQTFKPSASLVPCIFDAVDRENVNAIRSSSVEQIFFPLGVTTPAGFDASTRQRSITDGRFRLILYSDGTNPEFYDERVDPLEATDIYGNLNAEQEVAYNGLYSALTGELPV